MELKISNVGIIEDSSIKLDGLTVITGSNNSGKTTVGKVLYALSEAISNYQDKIKLEKDLEIQRRIREVYSNLGFLRFVEDELHCYSEGMFNNSPLIYNFVKTGEINRLPVGKITEYARNLLGEIVTIEDFLRKKYVVEESSLNDNEKNKRIIDFSLLRVGEVKVDLQTICTMLASQPNLKSVIRRRLTEALGTEFKNQVQPAKISNCKSKIVLSNDEIVFCEVRIEDNVVKTYDNEMYYEMPYDAVFLIDDAFVIDGIDYGRSKPLSQRDFDIANCRVMNHNKRLMNYLEAPTQERIVDSDFKTKDMFVLRLINTVVPGFIEQKSNGKYYVDNGVGLRLTNLATGSKILLIIKQLIENYFVTEKTLLILDEPEAHLHPEWQNIFAKIVCLLVKHIGVKILLTTHSPNFMLAIDGCMREECIADKCNFYVTESLDGYRVKYRMVNDDLNIIYDKFLEPFESSNDVREKYMYGGKNDK